jgi:hypothetical protein
VLRTDAPDVFARILELGAHETHEFDKLAGRPEPPPGDDDLVMTHARRIVLAENPDPAPAFDGPSRAEWERITTGR